jgi:serine/threonine-protein phosphatase 2A activator
VTREVQSVYWLEPAGSKGVWGLDDYSFLPFLWGASQLIDSEEITPSQISSDSLPATPYADEFLFVGALRFIRKMKSGPFHEHSPLLNSLT